MSELPPILLIVKASLFFVPGNKDLLIKVVETVAIGGSTDTTVKTISNEPLLGSFEAMVSLAEEEPVVLGEAVTLKLKVAPGAIEVILPS